MFEIAQNFEQIAVRFRPIVLIAPGLACLVVGLFVWLGGLGLRKLLVAIVGAVAGAVCGFFILGRNIISAMTLAAVAAAMAVIFERIVITIIAAALAMALGFAVLARPYPEKIGTDTATHQQNLGQDKIPGRYEFFSIRQTAEIIKEYVADFSTSITQARLQMPAHNQAVIAALGAIFIVAGVLFWRLTSALCCATLGTLLIFAGMILLLWYKGAAPISWIYNRTSFYAAVFGAMTGFGTIEQLLLCKSYQKHLRTKKQATKQDTNKTTDHWRT